jgi:hypothetical protein
MRMKISVEYFSFSKLRTFLMYVYLSDILKKNSYIFMPQRKCSIIISNWSYRADSWNVERYSGDLVQGKLPVKVSLTKLSKIFYASSRNSRRRSSEFRYIPQRDDIEKW